MLDIRKQAYDEEQSRRTDLKNAIGQLAAQLSAWEHSYLLKSPVRGKVTFMTVWSRNQNVKAGETVFTIQVRLYFLCRVRVRYMWDSGCIYV